MWIMRGVKIALLTSEVDEDNSASADVYFRLLLN